jgi:cobalt-precorrin 5A hydrolase
MAVVEDKSRLAVWAITPNGVGLAGNLSEKIRNVDLFFSSNVDVQVKAEASGLVFRKFDRLKPELEGCFDDYKGHVFIMSTGIVVRMIAPLIGHKTKDPAVVVVDDAGRFAISLLAGHIGGANRLTQEIAEFIGAAPVVTTATDVNNVPSIDLIAMETGLVIENPEAIKDINMAFLTGKKVKLHDPYGMLDTLEKVYAQSELTEDTPVVCVDDRLLDIKPGTLVLRPPTLVAGIGCNRGTDKAEIQELLLNVLQKNGLSEKSLTRIATVDIKNDEEGILELEASIKRSIENVQELYQDKAFNVLGDIEISLRLVQSEIKKLS